MPAGLSLAEAVAAVHEQGGIAVVAHPLLPAPLAASERLLVALAGGDPRCRPDALEAMHPVAAWMPGWRGRVERLAQRCGVAGHVRGKLRVGDARPRQLGETATWLPVSPMKAAWWSSTYCSSPRAGSTVTNTA